MTLHCSIRWNVAKVVLQLGIMGGVVERFAVTVDDS